jgi:hypothetical protein
VEYLGFGFFVTRRVMFEKMIRMYSLRYCSDRGGESVYPFFQQVVRSDLAGERQLSTLLSEDFSFCHRARGAGFSVHVDTRIKLGHVGQFIYTWDYLVTSSSVPDSLEIHLERQDEVSPE